MAASPRWKLWVCMVTERGSGGVVIGAGASGGCLGDIEGVADGGAEDLADDDCAK